MRIKILIILAAIWFLFISKVNAQMQKIDNLESRIVALEQYAETIQPTFVDFSQKLNQSVQDYTQGLAQNLDQYTAQLQNSLDERFKGLSGASVILDINSRSYQKVETNSGYFLVAIQSVKPTEQGYRVNLQIGNPYYADFKGVKITLTWGNKWIEGVKSFDQWRSGLLRAEFQYDGALSKSAWNSVEIEIPVTSVSQLGYIEIEMSVASVELQPAN